MLSKLKGLLSGKSLPGQLSPQKEKSILESGEVKERVALAARRDARPEVLYYLADDTEVAVRKNIAGNPSTPLQADQKLSTDESAEVRAELARKIARLMPGLNKDDKDTLREKAISVLESLAHDQLPKVRAILSQELKSTDAVPKSVVAKLARDIEDIVALPVLQYSPLLNDDDLREIIAAGTTSERLQAIAKRPEVSEELADDLSATLDVPTVAALLVNENAQIREDTLDQIIEQASTVEDLHKPLALRPQLSIRAVKRIAGFVASALVYEMISRNDLDETVADEILERVRERLQNERVDGGVEAEMAKKALDFFNRNMLDDAFITEQIEANRRELLFQCLALMADLPVKVIRQIILSKSGRAVTALAWRASLTMRTAYELQVKFALVPAAQLLPARNGKEYPIDDNELDWHLSYFLDQT